MINFKFELFTEKKIAIWGLGLYGLNCYSLLNKEKNIKIDLIIDKNKSKTEPIFQKIPVISPEEFTKISAEFFVIITVRSGNDFDVKYLEENCVKYIYFDNYYINQNINNFSKVYKLLDDKNSKLLFESLIAKRILLNGKMSKKLISNEQYFCLPEFQRKSNQLLIDCGAFVGDTFEKWLIMNEGNIGAYIGFDPVPKHKEIFNNRLKRISKEYIIKQKIRYETLFVSNIHETVELTNNGTKTTINTEKKGENKKFKIESNSIDNQSIDELIDNENIKSIVIKMDIEGAEYKALQGAYKTIKKYRPLIAVAVYHNIDDLARIPIYLASLKLNYKFYLRHHSPTFDETILYCVPN